jgi:putative methionine-R-sulfoxide reductase with GAF domain
MLAGWPLTCQREEPSAGQESLGDFLRSSQQSDVLRLCLPREVLLSKSKRAVAARQMGENLARLLGEFQSTRRALALREAELATAVPVVAPPEEASQLSQRLQSILRGAVEGLQGSAAALYLLDDATSELKLRAHWGLPSLRFVEPARPLRGSVADLEALTGHAVVVEDTSLLPHWNIPEDFTSAVCVPVSSPGAILGTFWLFCNRVRDFTAAETQLLEILAGRLAAELERSVLLREVSQAADVNRQAERFSQWHRDRNQLVPPLVDGWQVSAAALPQATTSGDFHFWRMTTANELFLAAGGAQGAAETRVLSSALLRGALQAQLLHDSDPCRALQQLNEVAWSGSPGDETANLFAGRLNLDTGTLESSSAGCPDAYILRPHGWEPIVKDGLGLGSNPEMTWERQAHVIAPGDVLLAVSDREHASDRPHGVDTTQVAETLLRHIHLRATELAQKAIQLIQHRTRDGRGRSVVIIKRCEHTPGAAR